jgi:hypothetical protein
MVFGLSVLSDLRAIAAHLRSGELLDAAAIAVQYTPDKNDDRAVALVREIVASNELSVWARKGYELLVLIAAATPTDLDNRIIEALDAVKDEQVFADLLAWIDSLWNMKDPPQMSAIGAFPFGAEGDPSKAIPIPILISIASLIVSLARLLKRGNQ